MRLLGWRTGAQRFASARRSWSTASCSSTDPVVLEAELDRVRGDYNGSRLHQGIDYVTPHDEREGRGEQIRQARLEGLRSAVGLWS